MQYKDFFISENIEYNHDNHVKILELYDILSDISSCQMKYIKNN